MNRVPGRWVLLPCLAILTWGLAADAVAQGTQSATLAGTVRSTDGEPLPGVSVSISSPALQGERSSVSDVNGAYIFRGLPPGTYKVKYSMTGFSTVERAVTLALGDSPDISTAMSVATVEETITVTGTAPSVLDTTTVGSNVRAERVDKLATGRTIQQIAELSPGLNDNTPNPGQLAISGAFAYDNVFLLNGVDINDNLFGTSNGLFIEDAIEEVQTLVTGISAEYGRFSGGVVNAVTKRGGNSFSGSFRIDFTNSAWRDETPFQKDNETENTDLTTKIYQATFGGPILKDHVWFFGAYRREKSTTSRTLTLTGIPYDFEVENPRYEGKLTVTPAANHTFQGTYIRNNTKQFNNPSINTTFSLVPVTLVNRVLPNDLFVVDYNGVLTSNLFVEGRYSQKKFGFRDTGGTSTDVLDSPFLALGRSGIPANRHYNAPYFDSNDPEDRNNKQFAAAVSYFLSTGSTGRHDLKAGFERFTSTRTGGNSQSSTGYVFQVDPVVVDGDIQMDGSGNVIPNFVSGTSRVQEWLPTRGAQLDITTQSFYVNDRWQLNERWSFNLGLRLEKISSEATGDITGIDSTSFSPRLGATFDVNGDGRYILQATYGHYSGKGAETQIGDNTPVGTPSLILRQYGGPSGEGLDFAPGFDIANYSTIIGGSFPTANWFFDSGLGTPKTREFSLSAGTRLGNRGEVKVTYSNRDMSDFLDEYITIDNGTTTVERDGRVFGTFDNRVVRNNNDATRKYQALLTQARYRFNDWWSLEGHWTLELENEGDFDGENANQPGIYSPWFDYPEINVLARNNPYGRMDSYQNNKVRLFSFVDLDLGKAGRPSLGVSYRWNSPLTHSLLVNNFPTNSIQRARDPGYATPPTTQTLYFGERNSGLYEGSHLVDLALNYEIPVFRTFRPWFKAELRNVFNSHPLIGFDTTISAVTDGPLDSDGLPTTYTEGTNFGTGTQDAHYPIPREFRFSVGFRF